MRDPVLLETRNQDIEQYFNDTYKGLSHGTESAKYNVACRETAAKFYLSVRTIQKILQGG